MVKVMVKSIISYHFSPFNGHETDIAPIFVAPSPFPGSLAQASTARLVAHVCTATASTVEVQELCHQRAVQLLEEPIMVNDIVEYLPSGYLT